MPDAAAGPAPDEILTFWREVGRARWYARDEALDAEITRRFRITWEHAVAGRLDWPDSDDAVLALILVLDHFPRNMFRNERRAFASDALARDVARRAIADGLDTRVGEELRAFVYLPLMHAEDIADQERCCALFRAAGDADNLPYADEHCAIIRRFGRFPHRNRVLGRVTTPGEQAYLDDGGFSG